MKKKLLALAMLAGGALFGQITIQIGPPPQPRILRVRPPQPGPGYVWVDGYWNPNGNRYQWHPGYWTRPPYDGALWINPRYESGMFNNGYWQGGGRERFEHNHGWDRDKRNRDYQRDERKDERKERKDERKEDRRDDHR